MSVTLYKSLIHEYSYGEDPLQTIDIAYPDNANGKLIIIVHGGGFEGGDKNAAIWTDPDTYLQEGYVVASVNYRLLPDVDWPVPVYDVADAINYTHLLCQTVSWLFGTPEINDVTVHGASAGAMILALLLYCSDFNVDLVSIDRFVGGCGLYNAEQIPTDISHMMIEDIENLTPDEIELLQYSLNKAVIMKNNLLQYSYQDMRNVPALLIQGTHDFLDKTYSIPMKYPNITVEEFWYWIANAHANYMYHCIKGDGGSAQTLWLEGSYHPNIYWFPECLNTIKTFIEG